MASLLIIYSSIGILIFGQVYNQRKQTHTRFPNTGYRVMEGGFWGLAAVPVDHRADGFTLIGPALEEIGVKT
jgi:hypothetical protein